MKYLFLLFLIFSFLNQSYARPGLKKLNVNANKENSLCRQFSQLRTDSTFFGLYPVKNSLKKLHLRVRIPGQILDIYKNENDTYQGTITNEISEYIQGHGDTKGQKEIFYSTPLNEGKVEEVLNKLIQSNQYEIPTDSLIPDWSFRSLHCSSITFEYKLNGQYYYQNFYCPWAQKDSIEFKKTIIDNFDYIKSAFRLDSLYRDFEKLLPKGRTYSKDGYRMMYIMTSSESASWNKSAPIRNHLSSVKNSVDSHIIAELKNKTIRFSGLDCFFEDFLLTFNDRGKLTKTKVHEYNRPKLKESLTYSKYLKDKKEVRKCIRTIKILFKDLDLSKFDPKYRFYRTITFRQDGEFYLYDKTIY